MNENNREPLYNIKAPEKSFIKKEVSKQSWAAKKMTCKKKHHLQADFTGKIAFVSGNNNHRYQAGKFH